MINDIHITLSLSVNSYQICGDMKVQSILLSTQTEVLSTMITCAEI
jgi:hypothetical protein